jgi:hypothetical protein
MLLRLPALKDLAVHQLNGLVLDVGSFLEGKIIGGNSNVKQCNDATKG